MQIEGRTVAVTGGARGIGRAVSERLIARGARVAVGDLAPVPVPGAALVGELDVTSRPSFEAFLARARSELGPLDVLINNAGILRVGPYLDEDDAWTRRQMDVNYHGTALGMKLALAEMQARGHGHVINLASVAARTGVAREASYSASKFAVYGLSEAVARELRGSGVHLSVVMPGLVRTELAAGTLSAPGSIVLEPDDVAAAVERTLERPRFDVFVPRGYDALLRVLVPLPRRMREALLRAAGAERATAATTREDRAAYEDRVAAALDGAASISHSRSSSA